MQDFRGLEPNQKLDKVISYLYKFPYGLPVEELTKHFYDPKAKFQERNKPEMQAILDYLTHQEKYTYEQIGLYKLTFRGSVFFENFGYKEATRLASEEKIRIDRNEERLRLATIWAAVGTISFLIWDIIKYGSDHDWYIFSWLHLK